MLASCPKCHPTQCTHILCIFIMRVRIFSFSVWEFLVESLEKNYGKITSGIIFIKTCRLNSKMILARCQLITLINTYSHSEAIYPSTFPCIMIMKKHVQFASFKVADAIYFVNLFRTLNLLKR